METSITREEGHAHVAAIRVLLHRLRALEGLGIISVVENPFEVHVSVEDYLALENLPVEADEDALKDAVKDFQKRQSEKADEMMRIFEESDEKREKKEKHDQMAEDLKRFKRKKPKKAPWETDEGS